MDLTDLEKKYLGYTLNKVSRSFALVIPSLEEPLQYYMATAYLICRVVDNIEDCEQPFAWKQQRFQEFHQLLEAPSSANQILGFWSDEPWPGLTQDEVEMMGKLKGSTLWEIYTRIPEKSRAIVRRWTSAMAEGMLSVENPDRQSFLMDQDGIRTLATEYDYNEYCFYVAGTVSHMATELAADAYRLAEDVTNRLTTTCEACGRGLQKTNIIKDFAEDIERGISYLPYSWLQEADSAPLSLAGAPLTWKKKVIDDAVRELHEATEYVLTLPYDAAGYRMSSLMCLLPAYQTLLLAAKRHGILFTSEHQIKISRPTMVKCQRDAQVMLNDNDALRRYSMRLESDINEYLA